MNHMIQLLDATNVLPRIVRRCTHVVSATAAVGRSRLPLL